MRINIPKIQVSQQRKVAASKSSSKQAFMKSAKKGTAQQ